MERVHRLVPAVNQTAGPQGAMWSSGRLVSAGTGGGDRSRSLILVAARDRLDLDGWPECDTERVRVTASCCRGRVRAAGDATVPLPRYGVAWGRKRRRVLSAR